MVPGEVSRKKKKEKKLADEAANVHCYYIYSKNFASSRFPRLPSCLQTRKVENTDRFDIICRQNLDPWSTFIHALFALNQPRGNCKIQKNPPARPRWQTKIHSQISSTQGRHRQLRSALPSPTHEPLILGFEMTGKQVPFANVHPLHILCYLSDIDSPCHPVSSIFSSWLGEYLPTDSSHPIEPAGRKKKISPKSMGMETSNL